MCFIHPQTGVKNFELVGLLENSFIINRSGDGG